MSSLVKRPTEVRLDESMLADFKKRIMVAQIQSPAGPSVDELKQIYTPVS
jgi:hypothetical protein